MVDYKKMYYIMIDATERAITQLNQQNYGVAKKTLITAERRAEEIYIQTAGDEEKQAE